MSILALEKQDTPIFYSDHGHRNAEGGFRYVDECKYLRAFYLRIFQADNPPRFLTIELGFTALMSQF